MQTLTDLQAAWKPTQAAAIRIATELTALTDADPKLKALRDFVERTAYGMGERAFYHMWKLIIQELPAKPRMMEIGVHRGQTLALWRTLSPNAKIIGLSPFDGVEVGPKRDYRDDVKTLFDFFELKHPDFIVGYSDHPDTIKEAHSKAKGLDVLYIDGGHSYETTKNDIEQYADLVKPGGYLVIDDCASSFPYPFGYFTGIPSVCRAVDSLLPPHGNSLLCGMFEHVAAVVHNRIWRKN